jgi:anti-sigma factor RsiW
MVKRISTRQDRSGKVEITCEWVTSLITDYLNRELDRETTLAFEKHLSFCSDCAAFLNTYKKTIQATQSSRYEDISLEMEKRVLEFIQKKIKRFSTRR